MTLGKHTTLFPPFTSVPSRSSSSSPSAHRYKVIHPLTPLSELETFLKDQEGHFALVTDRERKWVLGVATVSDLEVSACCVPGKVSELLMVQSCCFLACLIRPSSSGEAVLSECEQEYKYTPSPLEYVMMSTYIYLNAD